MITVATFAMFALATQTEALSPQGDTNAATRLLQEVREVYATCSTYQDEGQVETTSITLSDERSRGTTVRPFTTAFVRETGDFRFEFRDPPPSIRGHRPSS